MQICLSIHEPPDLPLKILYYEPISPFTLKAETAQSSCQGLPVSQISVCITSEFLRPTHNPYENNFTWNSPVHCFHQHCSQHPGPTTCLCTSKQVCELLMKCTIYLDKILPKIRLERPQHPC